MKERESVAEQDFLKSTFKCRVYLKSDNKNFGSEYKIGGRKTISNNFTIQDDATVGVVGEFGAIGICD